jgi:hypothetical protein
MTKQTFYGGKNGHDIVCMADIDGEFSVMASGSKTEMMELARERNYAVVKMEVLRFVQPEKAKVKKK